VGEPDRSVISGYLAYEVFILRVVYRPRRDAVDNLPCAQSHGMVPFVATAPESGCGGLLTAYFQ
jgi:hypothetical protein